MYKRQQRPYFLFLFYFNIILFILLSCSNEPRIELPEKDKKPPEITILTITNGQIIGDSYLLGGTITDLDNSGMSNQSKVKLYVKTGNDSFNELEVISNKWQTNITVQAPGYYTNYVYALDQEGNKSPEYQVIVQRFSGIPVITVSISSNLIYTNLKKLDISGRAVIDQPFEISIIEVGLNHFPFEQLTGIIQGQSIDWFKNIELIPNSTNILQTRVIGNNHITNTSDLFEIIEDEASPVITVKSVANNQQVGNAYTFFGSAVDNLSGIESVYVKLDDGIYSGLNITSGEWQTNYSISEIGKHTNYVYSVDKAGNTSSTDRIVVEYTFEMPSIIISKPMNGLITNLTNIALSGGASVGIFYSISKIEYSVNGYEYQTAGSFNLPDITWSKEMDDLIPDKTNSIQVRAIATSGKTNFSPIVNIIIDTSNPEVVILSPTNHSGVSNGYNLSGSAVDNLSGIQKVFTSIDNSNFLEAEFNNGNWNQTISGISYGWHTNRVYAIDYAGNVSSVKTNMVIRTSVPSISISSPVNLSITNRKDFEISGMAQIDPPFTIHKIDLTTNGSGYFNIAGITVNSNVNWSSDLIFKEGTNSVTARAIVDCGKTNTSAEILIVVDTTPPVSSITNLMNNTIRGNGFMVSGTAGDNISGVKNVYLAVDNGVFSTAAGDRNWNTNLNLTDGVHTIKVYAVDMQGNIGPTNQVTLNNTIAIYVSTTGNDANSGLAGSKIQSIQSGIDRSVMYGVEYVYVSEGVYTAGSGLNITGAGNGIVITNHNVKLLGGWDSTFSTRIGISRLNADSQYRVLYAKNSTNLMLDGFLFGNGYTFNEPGSGILLSNISDSLITNCVVSNNLTTGKDGGGIFIINGNGNNKIYGKVCDNESDYNGGGIYIKYSANNVIGADVIHNTAGDSGGGIYLDWKTSRAGFTGKILNNSAAQYGGGIYIQGDNMNPSSGITIQSAVCNNSAGISGSGLYLHDLADSSIMNSIITNNGGKAILLLSTGGFLNLSITGNLIGGVDKTGDYAIYEDTAGSDLIHHTMLSNTFITNRLKNLYYDFTYGDIDINRDDRINSPDISGSNYTGASLLGWNNETNL